MNRQDAVLRAVRANLRVGVGIEAFASIVIALNGYATWDIISTLWLGWIGFAVLIGVSRGWNGGM